MARAKKQVTELITRAQSEDVMLEYAEATSQIKGIEADLETQIQKIRDTKAKELLELKTKQNDAMDKLQYFAEFNANELFTKKKSLELAHGLIGFRTGNFKLKTVGTTLANAFEAIKLAKMKQFIRVKEELDKEKIIASREDDKIMSKMKAIGIEVTQDESFYVEVKEEQYA